MFFSATYFFINLPFDYQTDRSWSCFQETILKNPPNENMYFRLEGRLLGYCKILYTISPWCSTCYGTYYRYLPVLRIRITLMRIRIRIIVSKLRMKTLKKCSIRFLLHTFWLVICKLVRIRIHHFDADPYLDPDPSFRFDADPDPQHWYLRYHT